MAVFDLYSKRRKREREGAPDVYQYTAIPNTLRIQIIHIWKSAFGDPERGGDVGDAFHQVYDVLCREYGRLNLGDERQSWFDLVANFMVLAQDVEQVLDVIELTFLFLDRAVRRNSGNYRSSQNPDDAISELNTRFRERGFGFQYESGQVVRVDSRIIHSDVVKPALLFLAGQQFEGANQEFLSAHEHYRTGKTKECLNDCLKAFESTMKSICVKRGWEYKPTDTAKSLMDVLFRQELIPSFMQSHFTGLRSTLEAGVPTVRNKLGGHGQGVTEVEVPGYIAAYALHLTATNILFLAQADKASK